MIDQGTGTIEMIGTTEIATETERGTVRETVVEIVIGTAREIERGTVIGAETEAVNMTVTGTVIAIGNVTVIVIARGRGKETGIMKLGMTMIEVVLMIESMTMNVVIRNTSGVKERGIMVRQKQKMVVGGLISLSMGMDVQKLSMAMGTMTTMETKVGDNMIIQMPRVIMTATENLTVIMIAMIKWMMMVMVMIELHLSSKTGITGVQIGLFLASMSTKSQVRSDFVMIRRQRSCKAS